MITALWTENDNLPEGSTIHDISSDSKDRCKEEIEWFLDNTGDILDNVDDAEIGDDLWLTRNNHGSGFFDRSYSTEDLEILKTLTDKLGNVDVYNDKNGIIYFNSSDSYKDFDVEEFNKRIEIGKYMKKYNL